MRFHSEGRRASVWMYAAASILACRRQPLDELQELSLSCRPRALARANLPRRAGRGAARVGRSPALNANSGRAEGKTAQRTVSRKAIAERTPIHAVKGPSSERRSVPNRGFFPARQRCAKTAGLLSVIGFRESFIGDFRQFRADRRRVASPGGLYQANVNKVAARLRPRCRTFADEPPTAKYLFAVR